MAYIAGAGAGLDTARGVVAASTTRPKRRAIVAWLRQGGVLTDTSTAPPAVQDLVRYLIEAGARLPQTRCPGCGKPGRLRALGPEGRVCGGIQTAGPGAALAAVTIPAGRSRAVSAAREVLSRSAPTVT